MISTFKIGIDFHGVITALPDFFRRFNRLAIEKGCRVYVLSGGKRNDIKAYMNRFEIAYSHIWSLVDFFDRLSLVTYFPDGSFKVDDDLWNAGKAWYCRKIGINFHIDDSLLYGEYFATPFCLYNNHTKCCTWRGTNIDFTKDPQEVLAQIIETIKP